MSNGLQKLISKVDNCSTTTCAETLSKLGNVTDIISSTNYDSVASAASLPAAACNTGRFMAITGGTEVCYRYSNGTEWKCDYDTTVIAPTVELFTWGGNFNGQLGIGTCGSGTNRSSPVTTVAGGTNWCQVDAGSGHTSAIKTDGTLWVWGCGGYGRLGTGDATDRSSPVTTAGGGTTWCQVSLFSTNSAAIKTDGTLWTWGYNIYGQLGNNSQSDLSSPVTTAGGGTTWCQVSVGQSYSTAIKTDGTLWGWGWNGYGELGTGGTTNYSSPVTTAGGGTNWCRVYSGHQYSSAIKTDGTLWSMGRNVNGELGTGNTTSYSSPVTTAGGGTNWCQVSGGYQASAIKTDGTLWAWGYNGNGQLGTGNTTNYSSPVTTAGGGTNWCQVSSGNFHTTAIKTDGTLWVWGLGTIGRLGTGDTTNYSSPVTTIAGGTNWCQVSGGGGHSAAIKRVTKGF